jgi:methyl-accepting chemotaxis protein
MFSSGIVMPKARPVNASIITLGVKILIGVSLASNLCIGALLYVNLQSSETVQNKVNNVLYIREQLSSNLRDAIVSLQNEFLALPDFFKIDPRAKILRVITSKFEISGSETFNGRSAYAAYYNRKERRDLTHNNFIVQVISGQLIVSTGIPDKNGNFSDAVERFSLASTHPEHDAVQLRTLITQISSEADNPELLKQKVIELGAKVADSSLEAEKTRTEILQHIEEIRALESDLEVTRGQQRQFTIGMATLAILANMLVLFVLVRLIVERPLHKLTMTIEDIRSGNSPIVPYQHRTDQIGVLSSAIRNFREALMEIQAENERKATEKIIIAQMFDTITEVVDSLEARARELVSTANSLQDLAISTENQSKSVTLRAEETATHTDNVSASTNRLNSSFQDIQHKVHEQNLIVATIIERNNDSRRYIQELNNSISAIHSIITTVEGITDQTKLLALNATIEAARAGSAGKGFGVVASEVKQLSSRTEEATGDVMQKAHAIEQASSVLFQHLEDIDQRMQALNTITGNISGSVAEQQHVTNTIAGLTSQTSENTRNVSSSITEVGTAAAKTRNLASGVHTYSREISIQLTNLLEDTTGKLKRLEMMTTSDGS